jgi:invasin-like protein
MSRFVSRAAMLLLVVGGAITCSESPTNVRRAPVHLALSPHFGAQAATIYRSLSAFSVTIDHVRIVVQSLSEENNPGAVLKDTTVAFPANASELTIDLDLSIPTQEQLVLATMVLLQGSTPYFGGAQTFDAKQGETATASQPLELVYVGPGAAATSLHLTPVSPTLSPASSFQFTAQALDANEHAVADLPLSWTTSDATIATVTPTGLVTATVKGGTVTLTVSGLNGLSQQTTIRVQPVASLVVQSGGNQSGVAGSALPSSFKVQALDATQQPVIGAPITFAALNGVGSVSPTTATTDATGVAATTVTLGSAAGTYTFTASVGTGSTVVARIVATALAGPPASLGIVSGNQQADTVLATFAQPLTVVVHDASGNVVPNQTVNFQVSAGQAFVKTATDTLPSVANQATTNANGTASATLVGGPLAGTVHVTATVAGNTQATATFEATLRPGTPIQLTMIQQPAPTAQATIPLGRQPKVQVADLYGNPVAVAGLAVRVSPEFDCGTGAACGRIQAPRPGGALLDRSAAPAIARGPASRPPLSRAVPRTSRIAVPTSIAATQSVSDTFPRGVGGKTIVLTDGNGVASFSDLALDESVGNWVLAFTDTTFTYGAAISSSIALSPGPITSIVAQGAADTLFFSTTSDTLHPAAVVIDAVGNGIPGVTVTWAILNGNSKLDSLTTTTDANGVASPGNWLLLPIVGAANNYAIQATPSSGTKVENSPLIIVAMPLPQ